MQQTKKLAVCAMLIALGVVLGGMLNIPVFNLGIYSMKIGFGVLPVIIAAIMYGPLYGGMVGGLVDILQFVFFPKGAYEPWFTVIGVLFGVIPGLFFMKNQAPKFWRIFIAVFVGQVFSSVICNSVLLVKLYGLTYEAILPGRIVNQAVMIPLYTVISYYVLNGFKVKGLKSAKSSSKRKK